MGLMIASDIFQQKINELFNNMQDVIVNIYNILIFTKSDFFNIYNDSNLYFK